MISKNVNSFSIRIKKRLKLMSESAFKGKVENLSKEMNNVMVMSKDAVKKYLMGYWGLGSNYGKIPKTITENLVRNIAQGQINSKPKYRQIGSVYVATFKGWYALDNNGKGRHTVVSPDDRSAPYASYLNYSKAKNNIAYNGFFDLTKDIYRQTLINNFESKYEQAFEKTYRY